MFSSFVLLFLWALHREMKNTKSFYDVQRVRKHVKTTTRNLKCRFPYQWFIFISFFFFVWLGTFFFEIFNNKMSKLNWNGVARDSIWSITLAHISDEQKKSNKWFQVCPKINLTSFPPLQSSSVSVIYFFPVWKVHTLLTSRDPWSITTSNYVKSTRNWQINEQNQSGGILHKRFSSEKSFHIYDKNFNHSNSEKKNNENGRSNGKINWTQ